MDLRTSHIANNIVLLDSRRLHSYPLLRRSTESPNHKSRRPNSRVQSHNRLLSSYPLDARKYAFTTAFTGVSPTHTVHQRQQENTHTSCISQHRCQCVCDRFDIWDSESKTELKYCFSCAWATFSFSSSSFNHR